jgi:hypothetical protein
MLENLTIIHASRSEKTISADIYSELSDDTLIATSKSAYNTQDIFYQYIVDFQEKTQAGKGNPQFLWMDNHELHWSGKAIG